ncbi:bifunctional proline dehydrogenase/L-glutamate gamma-semialdehyde dehydrogenase PutA [Arenimonas composti]|uniref:Bifunctional protein PutA n=1 Tax=Arenimonas composti TR7-09 = DSM 18010 TaxID=1121013 RepID=A0A091BB15_9GAMM|nr:bifunctional proline dehydrogenase/L-glutamate gamma-semialdehyde dehydrogenase PutA [Arenimonas composti]KFN49853.1 pyrroline-5-carboxylate dehydrogenase [Arenimonas composti TR7-09 = DSM 18010]
MSPILSPELPAAVPPLRAAITAAWHRDEAEHLADLLEQARLPAEAQARVQATAVELVERTRRRAADPGMVEAFMRQYDLSSEEGVLLMCVAEALLRIPDRGTADKLIRDKLGDADWDRHVGQSSSMLVNASTWGLMLTGRMVNLAGETRRDAMGAFRRLVGRAGEPAIRLAVRQAMRIMGHQFVMGRSIQEALERSRKGEQARYMYSFDMLGEAALTQADADRYLRAYEDAIAAIGAGGPYPDVLTAPSISVKLSALHPRYEVAKRARVLAELTPRVLALARLAKAQGIGFTIDAEESERLELSLDVIAAAFADPSLDGWEGYGLAVQAYQKRCPFVIDFLADLARRVGRRMPVRLVKGAYWDSEIKKAQAEGYAGYPVFTRKANTDVSYLANARRMFANHDALHPMFATHNAQTIAAIHHFSEGRRFEYQKLHGMGDDLYAEVIPADRLNVPCRVYAPVGSHEDLLPYLVRRLLENGANSSFVNRITDESLPAAELVADPVATVAAYASKPHTRISQPRDLYRFAGEARNNSMGANLSNDDTLAALADQINAAVKPWAATPLVPGANPSGAAIAVSNPADRRQRIGEWTPADAATVEQALKNAVAAHEGWDSTPAASRAAILEHAADQLEKRMPEFIALCVKEAGKSLSASVAEVREAVDFLRYYALKAREQFGQPIPLPGPTGESNQLSLHGRGVFVCISPWNFPLAIYLGQIAAALASGNAVIAKPAEQTTLTAFVATRLLHEAGVPKDVLQFLPGDGATVGAALTRDLRVDGVCFTGSTETAWAINRALAGRNGPIAALIAETGGQNALIADSSALPEQLVKDAIASAFDSAGQRCSAARVLFVQADIADKVVKMLAGAMDELVVGDPALLSTDVGPVIDEDARKVLVEHAARMDREATPIKAVTLPEATAHGSFFAPRAYEIASLSQLQREVFGPVLHVIRWKADELDAVLDAINATGYGLTLGIHSRIDSTIARIAARVKVGNCYVNRNQIGAVVGVQPFGGEGLSGTGPKAGGPHYLLRFATERTMTVNTTAAGGNASLLTLDD